MFKRRVTIFGAAAVLALAGLTGSAAADGGSGRTDGSPGHAGTVVCTTSDGRTFTLTEGVVGRPAPEDPSWRHAAPKAGTAEKGRAPIAKAPIVRYHAHGEGVPGAEAAVTPGKRLERGETVHLERAQAGRARPAERLDADELPAPPQLDGKDGKDAKKVVTIDCRGN